MAQFELIQYGYLGLLMFMLYHSSKIIQLYIQTEKQNITTIILIGMFILLSIIGGIAGYSWSKIELEATNKKQNEIEKARLRLQNNTDKLRNMRIKFLEETVELSNTDKMKKEYKTQANEISNIINEHEKNYQNELDSLVKILSTKDKL